jgi:murein tripeptide amidase MpaA
MPAVSHHRLHPVTGLPRGRVPAGRSLSGIVSVLLAMSPGALAPAADVSIKPGDQVLRVHVETADQLKQLEALDLDIWSHEVGIGPVDVHVSIAERAAIDALGLRTDILNPDLMGSHARFMADNLLARGLGTPFDSYLPLGDLWQFFDNLEAARPDLCQEIGAIGLSVESRPIRVWRITGPDPGPKPGVFYHGLQHAREWITGPTVMYLANHLVSRYDVDPCIADLVNRTEFYLAPCVNPDGYDFTWTSTRLWRKNRRNNLDGTFGVDLNRNWAYGWGGGGSSGVTSSETYRGTAPFSEPETAALSGFVTSHPGIRAYMDYHSYSQLILWPYGNVCATPPAPDDARFSALGNAMQQLIQSVHGQFYEPGPICLTLYQASGSSVDWAYGSAGRTAFTIELRDTGAFGFELPPDQILPNCEENLPAILYLSRWATYGILVEPAGPLPAQIPAGQPATLTATINSAQDTYLPGSGNLHYRFGPSGPFSTVPLAPAGGNDYSATLPAGPCGATVEFYFSASPTAGGTVTAPCSAPAAVYTAAIAGITPVFTDNFETDQGWTASVEGATAGGWQRGVPVNDPNWAYDPPADADGSGSCYLTQNAVGNTDVDNGTVLLVSPPLDLTGGNLSIAYDYYLNLTVADGADMLRVEANSTDGVGTWTTIAVHTTSGGLAWRHHEIPDSALVAAGLALTPTLRLRFSANDAGTQSIVEAGLDGFAVIRAGCPCALPGDLNGDGLIDSLDLQGMIDAMSVSPFYAPCADLSAPVGSLDSADVDALVALLLG